MSNENIIIETALLIILLITAKINDACFIIWCRWRSFPLLHIINLRRLVSVLFIFAQYGELSTRPGRSAGDSERRGDCLESASQCLIVRRRSASASVEVIV